MGLPLPAAEFFGVSDMTVAPRLDGDPSGNARQIQNLRSTSNGVAEKPSDQTTGAKKGTPLDPLPETGPLADTLSPPQGAPLAQTDGASLAEAVAPGQATTQADAVAANLAETSTKVASSVDPASPNAAKGLASAPLPMISPRAAVPEVVQTPAQMRDEFIQLVKDVFERQRIASIGMVNGGANGVAVGAATGVANGFVTGLATGLVAGLAPGVAPGAATGVVMPGVVAEGVVTQGLVTPGVVTPEGVTPEGVVPGGVATGVVAPEGVAPAGVAPGGVTTGVVTPGGMATGLAPGTVVLPGAAPWVVPGLTAALTTRLPAGVPLGAIPQMTLKVLSGEPLTQDIMKVGAAGNPCHFHVNRLWNVALLAETCG
jgi:hypothetical protein